MARVILDGVEADVVAINKLTESSKRLERLTKVLIIITVVLAILTTASEYSLLVSKDNTINPIFWNSLAVFFGITLVVGVILIVIDKIVFKGKIFNLLN